MPFRWNLANLKNFPFPGIIKKAYLGNSEQAFAQSNCNRPVSNFSSKWDRYPCPLYRDSVYSFQRSCFNCSDKRMGFRDGGFYFFPGNFLRSLLHLVHHKTVQKSLAQGNNIRKSNPKAGLVKGWYSKKKERKRKRKKKEKKKKEKKKKGKKKKKKDN